MKKWIKYLIIVAILTMGISMVKTVSADTLLPNGKVVKNYKNKYFGDREEYKFKYDGQSVYLGYVEFKSVYEDNYYGKNKIKLSLCEYSEDNTSEKTLANYYVRENWIGYIYDGDSMKYGHTYAIRIKNVGEGGSFNVHFQVERYKGYAKNVKIDKKMCMKTGNVKLIDLKSISPYGSFAGMDWKSSNPKIATVNDLGYVTAKKKGTCVLTGSLNNGKRITCKVIVSLPEPYINYSAYTLNKGQTGKLKIYNAEKAVKWSSSNKRVATVTSSGKIKATGAGQCTITGTIGKKKLSCKVKVVYREPDFYADLIGYNTRDNYFVVKFKNYGKKSVYIIPGNNKVEHVDYRVYDRYLQMSGGKTVTVKPKKTVYIKFYVRGSLTWYDYSDYTLFYKFSYDGKQYEGHVWHDDSVYKRGKKWYTTYWVDD